MTCSHSEMLPAVVETITSQISVNGSQADPNTTENGRLHDFLVTKGLLPSGHITNRFSGDRWDNRAAKLSFLIA